MKRYLFTMAILLCLALAAGVVVWYLYQDLNPKVLLEEELAPTAMEPAPVEPPQSATGTEDTQVGGDEAITIQTDSLTESQKAALRAFGVEGEVVITEAMIACAETELGSERLNEIVNGAAPTPLEALSLVPCMRAR